MKFLLTVVALAAVVCAAPTTTQTMEIGANGAVSGSVSTLQNIPLVEIIVNMIKDDQNTPETATEPVQDVHPVIVVDEAVNTEPVAVVDLPIVVVPELPEVNPVQPTPVVPVPVPIALPEPTPAEVVPSPIVLPEPTPAEVVPAPIVLPEPTPAEVVPAPLVLPEPTPVQVVDVPETVAPAPVEVAHESADDGSSHIINVVMNFVFGASGSLSSVELPSNVIPQITPRV